MFSASPNDGKDEMGRHCPVMLCCFCSCIAPGIFIECSYIDSFHLRLKKKGVQQIVVNVLKPNLNVARAATEAVLLPPAEVLNLLNV